MKTLTLDEKRLFYYYLTHPDITSFDENGDEKFRLISEKMKESKQHTVLLYQWNNKLGVAGTAIDGIGGSYTIPKSIKEFNVDDIEGLVLVNTRPARGIGFVSLEVKLKSGQMNELFLFFMGDNSSDVARWDKKVKVFEDEVVPGILLFMNTTLLRKVEDYNC